MLAMNIGRTLLFVISLIPGVYSHDDSETNCIHRMRLTGTEADDMHRLVEAILNQTVKMECHFWYELLIFIFSPFQ
jgi:hypothetical protein